MASIKVNPKPEPRRRNVEDQEVANAIWANAERQSREEVRRNARRKLKLFSSR